MKITKEMLKNLIVESLEEMHFDPALAGEREEEEKGVFKQLYNEKEALIAELHSVIRAVEEDKNPKDILEMLQGTVNSLRAAVGE